MNGDRIESILRELRGRRASERDLCERLVRPIVLVEHLGFRDEDIHAEQSANGDRPDYLCMDEGGSLEVIVEAKRLGTDLGRASASAMGVISPHAQIRGYLRRHPKARSGTRGLLTNGIDYWLYEREGEDVPPPIQGKATTEKELRKILDAWRARTERRAQTEAQNVPEDEWVQELLKRVAGNSQSADVLEVARPEISRLETPVTKGRASWVQSPCEDDKSDSLFQEAYLVCLPVETPNGELGPGDLQEELKELWRTQLGQASLLYGFAWSKGNVDHPPRLRGFVWRPDGFKTTSSMDPQLPSPHAVRQLRSMRKAASKGDGKTLWGALDSKDMQRRFFDEVSDWAKRMGGKEPELRHMVRVLFVWLLKERGLLPQDAIEPAPGTNIHERLMWLFTKVMAVPLHERTLSENETERGLEPRVPFLNGSLFPEAGEEPDPKPLSNEAYVGTGEKPGLFTILDRYEWTLSELPSGFEEAAVDPTTMGQLFERLIIDLRNVKTGLGAKMPDGSYYTPRDIADEMAFDAISSALETVLPVLPRQELHELLRPTTSRRPWEQWTPGAQERILRALRDLTFLDLCCGSGDFTIAVMDALARGERRLSGDFDRSKALRRMVGIQTYAIDIEPLAVLITKLRVFISIVDGENSAETLTPLPNLETRIIACNALATEPEQSNEQISLFAPNFSKTVADWQSARELYTLAHGRKEKGNAREEEQTARRRLGEEIKHAKPHANTDWLGFDPTRPDGPHVDLDPRRALAELEGFDIVIGNPPYEGNSKKEREELKRRGYKAGGCGNRYAGITEAAFHLAKPYGTVNLIVPHSITFSRNFRPLRTVIEKACSKISWRTYDNMPQPVFPPLPWLKTAGTGTQNRQRVTIVTARKGETEPRLLSGGLFRLRSRNRARVLQARIEEPQDRLPIWSNAPTRETNELLRRMYAPAKQPTAGPYGCATHQPTAMYFAAVLPPERIDNPGRKSISISKEDYWLWLSLYNGEIWHAFWLMTGDAFHVTTRSYFNIKPPPGWTDKNIRQELTETTQVLCSLDYVGACTTVKKMGGIDFANVNFHRNAKAAALVETLDRLNLRAYGLDPTSILSDLRTMRTGSAHEFTRQS